MELPDFLTLLDGADSPRAVLEDAESSTYLSEIRSAVDDLASALIRRGVSEGDRVAVMLPNSVAAVQMYLAVARVGAIWVGLNPATPTAERDRQCALVDPVVIVTDLEMSWSYPGALMSTLGEMKEAGRRRELPTPPGADAPCAIGFSSGTTGTPKALVHSRSAVSTAAATYAHARLATDDRVGVILPMSIHNLMVVGVLPALLVGATCVAVGRLNAAAVAQACATRQLTTLNALVPATIYDLVHDDTVTPDMLRTLRSAGTGAAGLSESLRAQFEDKFGVRLVGSYGMTEAPGAVCIEDPAEPHVPGSSGRPLPHLQVTACAEDGTDLPARSEGELTIRATESGPFARRYRPAMGIWTGGALALRADQVLRTGDYGWVDTDGTVHVSGRRSDILVRGGVTVNAAELEHLLGEWEDVRDVAVLGRPDERLGQRIVAFVEPVAGVSIDGHGLRERARGILAHGKVPDEFVLGVLPRNAMGKVARAELRRTPSTSENTSANPC